MIQSTIRRVVLVTTLLASCTAMPLQAQLDPEIEAAARRYMAENVSDWLTDEVILKALSAQNLRHADLTRQQIDALDERWRQQSVSGGPLIDKVLGNALSARLQAIEQNSNGMITEIFVMDNRGLNVGLSSLTSDYWQGDEDKWLKSYRAGAQAIHIAEVDMDESSQRYQTQVSVPVLDPGSGKIIGAVTVGIDAEGLLMY